MAAGGHRDNLSHGVSDSVDWNVLRQTPLMINKASWDHGVLTRGNVCDLCMFTVLRNRAKQPPGPASTAPGHAGGQNASYVIVVLYPEGRVSSVGDAQTSTEHWGFGNMGCHSKKCKMGAISEHTSHLGSLQETWRSTEGRMGLFETGSDHALGLRYHQQQPVAVAVLLPIQPFKINIKQNNLVINT